MRTWIEICHYAYYFFLVFSCAQKEQMIKGGEGKRERREEGKRMTQDELTGDRGEIDMGRKEKGRDGGVEKVGFFLQVVPSINCPCVCDVRACVCLGECKQVCGC